jgi:hypothetical protein
LGISRARAKINPMANSATAVVVELGALTTLISFSLAAATSILSTPTPARPITFRFLPASMTSRVTFVRPADDGIIISNFFDQVFCGNTFTVVHFCFFRENTHPRICNPSVTIFSKYP